MPLAEYRRKRDFRKTAEPRGGKSRRTRWLYVVQKHAASHLHYDFRLQLDDVLKSWAIPKGPSLDPADKRLAIEVEDHPVEYGSFEGVIPEGEYGGGTVMLWDRGTWEPLEDPHAGYRAGTLKFNLNGEKLHGSWALVRTSRSTGSSKPQWILIKHRDEAARDKTDFDVALQEPLSVATGRDLDQIASDRDRVWGSNRDSSNGKPKTAKRSTAHRATKAVSASRTSGDVVKPADDAVDKPLPRIARGHEKPPRIIEPQLATLVKSPPDGDQWIHEIKFDGYRIVANVDGGHVRFQTRNKLDWTAKLPQLAEAVRRLKLRRTVFDGEIVALDEHGVSHFQLLQNAFRDSPGKIIFCAFDLLFYNGSDLRPRPLEERKALLESLNLPTDRGLIRYVEHVEGHGAEFLKAAEKQGLEGIISKRRDRPYFSGRTADWLKCKTHQSGEFVIGGFTDPAGTRTDFGALLVGYHDRDGRLLYAGKVGTGFTSKTLADVLKRLKPLTQDKSPFADFPPRGARPREVHWVRPELVAQVVFSNWTGDRRLRHPSFQGLREDKPAEDVTMETPAAKPVTKRSSRGRAAHSVESEDQPAEHRAAPTSRSKGAKSSGNVVIEGVELTHPDRVFFPDDGITKRELADYYLAVAERMLTHVVDRPLSIVRCPAGINGQRFFQKHLGDSAPRALHPVTIKEKSGSAEYFYVKDAAGLVALAQIAALEIHVWGSRIDSIEKPDQLIFDLDPAPEVDWPRIVAAAQEIREFLRELGLESFVKTSGGKGLHLVVPIVRRQTWDFVDGFCHQVALAVERAAPARYVSNMSKKKRSDKIFVDYLRNQRGATAVAPFSTRAKPGAPVAMPLSWRELPRTTGSTQYTLRDIVKRRIAERADPWTGFFEVRQSISDKSLRLLKSVAS